ncbi:hypothetical protein CEXT_188971 [Caerostris extrusa]|uniref:Uncharacterized protein n=1 Tax=Caerostris extrusa TaxID=172846 RepID=A0AAV4NR30_CAEEX|nr:hypothetical protein CEXT_188971 [Caerostris extrusa]
MTSWRNRLQHLPLSPWTGGWRSRPLHPSFRRQMGHARGSSKGATEARARPSCSFLSRSDTRVRHPRAQIPRFLVTADGATKKGLFCGESLEKSFAVCV